MSFPLALIALSAACGDDDAPHAMPDASSADDAAPAFAVEAPLPPEAPRSRRCAAGYREASEGAGCERDDVLPDCGPTEARFGVDASCVGVGLACEGTFAADLPADRPVRYVDPSVTGGDGTRERPLASIAEALIDPPPRLVIALSRGRHVGAFELPAGVLVRGACASGSTIANDGTMTTRALVHTTAAGIGIEELTIEPGRRPAFAAIGAGASARLQSVIVRGGASASVMAMDGAHLEIEASLIDPGTGIDQTYGALAAVGSELTLTRVAIRDGNHVGAIASADSTLRVVDSRIERIAGPGAAYSPAISVEEGSQAFVEGSALLETAGCAIQVRDAAIAVSDSMIAGVHANDRGETFDAVMVLGDSDAEVVRTQLADNVGVAFGAGQGARLRLRDVIARGRGMPEPDERPAGMIASVGAELVLERVVLTRYPYIGVIVDGEGTRAELTDFLVDDVAMLEDRVGWGMSIQEGASASLTRVRIEGTEQVGLVSILGARVDVTDLAIAGVRAGPAEDGGTGLAAVMAAGGSTIVGERVDVAGVDGIGAMSVGMGSLIDLRDARIATVERLPCAATTCSQRGYGLGTIAFLDGAIALSRFAIERSALCAVQIALGGRVQLEDGVVAESAVGACVQVDDYDLGQLTERVSYRDNTTNLDSTDLPVPMATTKLDVDVEIGQ